MFYSLDQCPPFQLWLFSELDLLRIDSICSFSAKIYSVFIFKAISFLLIILWKLDWENQFNSKSIDKHNVLNISLDFTLCRGIEMFFGSNLSTPMPNFVSC